MDHLTRSANPPLAHAERGADRCTIRDEHSASTEVGILINAAALGLMAPTVIAGQAILSASPSSPDRSDSAYRSPGEPRRRQSYEPPSDFADRSKCSALLLPGVSRVFLNRLASFLIDVLTEVFE